MQPPVIIYASVASQTIPVLVGFARPSRADSARVWIMLWCAFYFIMNLGARYLAVHQQNNHPVTYVALPVQAFAILWALSLWQTKPTAKLTLRLAIPLSIASFLVLILLVENVLTFSAVAEPVYSLLALGAALYTLLTRSTQETEPLMRQDWFWICMGLILHFGALAVLTPLGAAFVDSNPALVMRAIELRAGLNIAAYIIIAIGIACPPSIRSGHSS